MNFFNIITQEVILEFVEKSGPLMAIGLPIIEALIPVLPLALLVAINVTVFGFFWGYLYSWIGNCLGSFLLFLIVRKIGGKKIKEKIMNSKYKNALEKINQNNFSLLFFLYCFPFTPSFLLTGASALADMSNRRFLLALLPSKLIMLISWAFLGYNVKSFFENPVRSIIFVLLVLLLNILLKKLLTKLNFLKK